MLNRHREIKSIALSWDFHHHANSSGYKKILQYTQPMVTFGVNERDQSNLQAMKRRLPWISEFQARRYHSVKPCDVLHVLYGEIFLRFSPWLFTKTPIVATFHQPPELLDDQLAHGDGSSRVSSMLHAMTKNRFSKLSSAIITSEQQRSVLTQYVPNERIHCIPLGVAANYLFAKERMLRQERNQSVILTVGNWQRDWDFYFQFVVYCAKYRPKWQFVVINKKIERRNYRRLSEQTNVSILRDVSDDTLFSYLSSSGTLFLPLLGAAGNNAVNEALAMGCPVATNSHLDFQTGLPIISTFDKNLENAISTLDRQLSLGGCELNVLRKEAQKAIKLNDWSTIGEKTLDLYQSVVRTSD